VGYKEAVDEAAKAAGISDDYVTEIVSVAPGLFQIDEDSLLMKEPSLAELGLGLFSPKSLRDLHWMTTSTENPFSYWAPVSRLE
jgi:hypothetical protein